MGKGASSETALRKGRSVNRKKELKGVNCDAVLECACIAPSGMYLGSFGASYWPQLRFPSCPYLCHTFVSTLAIPLVHIYGPYLCHTYAPHLWSIPMLDIY